MKTFLQFDCSKGDRLPFIFSATFCSELNGVHMFERKNGGRDKLPWWTWVAPFVLFYLSTYVSDLFKAPTGSLLFYLPIPLGIILIHWWGPRVLAGLFLNSLLLTPFWESPASWQPFVLLHETACVFASWYFFSYRQKGKAWLPDILSVLQFIGLGIVIPVTVNSVFIFLAVSSKYENIDGHLAMIWTSDFASSLALTLPVLYFITPGLEQSGLCLQRGSEYVKPATGIRLIRPLRIEIGIFFISLLLLSTFLPIEKYWYILGLFCVYIGVRFGFALSLLANLAVFTLTYVAPFFSSLTGKFSWALETELLNIHFGMCLLGMTACISGRVISDLKTVEKKMSLQFKELEQAHDELDHFVYSASHDLSAPIKSILGLIAISRLEKGTLRHRDYIDKIEVSTLKLDNFIKEILEYSRNSRLENEVESIDLRALLSEVFENFKHQEELRSIDIRIQDQISQIKTDRMRTKIILRNLISNAIKYQDYNNGHIPTISIKSEMNHNYVLIHVKDNGHGIREEHLGKIFQMFFRGTQHSSGSGLGLYIAKEAAEKMNGKITVSSIHGRGSTFTVHLPKQ